MKLAALALVIAALGLPLNDLPRFALLVVAAVLVFTGTGVDEPSCDGSARWRWRLYACSRRSRCRSPRIEEGHNVFLVDRPGGALEAGLPPAGLPPDARRIRRPLSAGAAAAIPRSTAAGAAQGFPDRAFAFSADGMFDRPAFSRRVSGIDFADPVWLRLGFINENRYNWNSLVSDVERASRDRRVSALLHHWRLEMPWFVMYRFPADFVGSALCWRGEVLWEGAAGEFATIRHADMACRTLTRGRYRTAHLRRRDPQRSTARHAARSDRQSARVADAGDGAAADRRGGGAAAAGELAAAPYAAAVHVHRASRSRRGVLQRSELHRRRAAVRFRRRRPRLRRLCARRCCNICWRATSTARCAGEESVFYFTPGMRYLRAFEHVIFGESYLGYLALMMFLPMLVFALFRRFLPLRWALALALTFTAIPIGVLFGSSLVLYVKWAARGFGDPAAYVCFLAGLLLLVARRPQAADRARAIASRRPAAPACCLRWRCSCGPISRLRRHPAGGRRPCGALADAVPPRSPACASASCRCSGWRCTTGSMAVCSCCSRTSATVAQSMPPSAYVAAFAELLRLDFTGEHVTQALHQLGAGSPVRRNFVVMAPLHRRGDRGAGARRRYGERSDPWLRLIAGRDAGAALRQSLLPDLRRATTT